MGRCNRKRSQQFPPPEFSWTYHEKIAERIRDFTVEEAALNFAGGGERFGKLGRCRCGEGLWLRHERRERLTLPSGTRGRDAFGLRLFRGMGYAIEGLAFHFLGGERIANLFRESSAQRSGLGAFFELPCGSR